jgi:hypothetical protein
MNQSTFDLLTAMIQKLEDMADDIKRIEHKMADDGRDYYRLPDQSLVQMWELLKRVKAGMPQNTGSPYDLSNRKKLK